MWLRLESLIFLLVIKFTPSFDRTRLACAVKRNEVFVTALEFDFE